MSRGHVEYSRAAHRAAEPLLIAGEALGLIGFTLSRDGATGAATAIVEAAPLWRADDRLAFDADIEVLVLAGDMRLAGLELAAGDYLHLPAGTGTGEWSSTGGATLLWMPAAELRHASHGPAGPVLLQRTREMPWSAPPSFEGRTVEETVSGLSVKFLRETGDGPYTLLARHAAGWADPRLESHETWEELLLLEGDYLMGSTGAIDAGAYIFRPGIRPHGPQATRTGAVWFCRGERRIDFRFTQPEWAHEHVRRYLERGSGSPRSAPWGRWY